MPEMQTVAETLAWTEYPIQNPDIATALLEEHVSRYGDDVEVDRSGMEPVFTLQDGDGAFQEGERFSRRHRYRVGQDGTLYSSFQIEPESDCAVEDVLADERQRHETITEQRFRPVLGRAAKTQEFVEYVQSFEPYGVDETVFSAYADGPVLFSGELEKAVMEEHNREQVEQIREETVLFDRAGAVDVPDCAYDRLYEQVIGEDKYRDAAAEPASIDFEICTKGREMSDMYSEDDEGRQEMESIYQTVLSCAAAELGISSLRVPAYSRREDW